uniref:(northern house mosquito) hypothetical protein n=1 Tax=Culex pipiens TaxID=7175 RepID=A0A8D8MBW6_CULPI
MLGSAAAGVPQRTGGTVREYPNRQLGHGVQAQPYAIGAVLCDCAPPHHPARQRGQHAGCPVDGTNLGRFRQPTVDPFGSIPIGGRLSHDAAQHFARVGGVPEGHRAQHCPGVTVHGDRERDYGHGAGRW